MSLHYLNNIIYIISEWPLYKKLSILKQSENRISKSELEKLENWIGRTWKIG